MKNIIKSIVYEMLHSKMVIRLYVLFMLLQALVVILNAEVSPVSGVKETSMVLSDGGVLTYEFPIFILTLIVGVICGEDYRDKVANYEVLSGHSRKSIYLARSLFAIFSAAALCLILSFIPLIAGNLYMGWGSTLKLGDVVARYLLLFFPYLRLAAFLAMITFLIKNQYIMMALGFLIMFGSTLLSDLLGASNYYVSIYIPPPRLHPRRHSRQGRRCQQFVPAVPSATGPKGQVWSFVFSFFTFCDLFQLFNFLQKSSTQLAPSEASASGLRPKPPLMTAGRSFSERSFEMSNTESSAST